jgi:hypothetical protein
MHHRFALVAALFFSLLLVAVSRAHAQQFELINSFAGILHHFPGTGPGGCGSASVAFGGDGLLYGIGTRCGTTGSDTIYRVDGLTFETLQEFPAAQGLVTPLINIPDAAVLPAGDYYWVAIVDADANGVPDGHYVDFVKTTKAAAALQRKR